MKCTVVSTLPFKLTEHKPGLTPGYYEIPAAPKNGFSKLIVEDGFHLILVPLSDDKAPPMKVTDIGEKLATSIINDYTASCIAISYDKIEDILDPTRDGAIPIPGLFWVEGALTDKEIETKHTERLIQAHKNTTAWFERLVKMADDEWARNHQHKTISDMQRYACKYLNLNREWNYDITISAANIYCWSCKASISPEAIICSTCRAIIKKDEYAKRKGEFANA